MTYKFCVTGAEFDVPPRLDLQSNELSEECVGIWVETAPTLGHAIRSLKERLAAQVGFPCIDVGYEIDVM